MDENPDKKVDEAPITETPTESMPEPEPAPATGPVSTPELESQPATEPVIEPVSTPETTPASEPTPAPEAPIPESTPAEPTATPAEPAPTPVTEGLTGDALVAAAALEEAPVQPVVDPAASASDPAPAPEPQPVAAPEPVPTPEPVPVAAVAPASEPQPAPGAAPEPTPATPIAEPAVAPEPTPVVAPESASTPVVAPEPIPAPTPVAPAAEQPAPTPAPAKKSKAPLPLIATLAVLLLATIGGIVWWLIARSTPEAQALDAITNLTTAKHVAVRGSVDLEISNHTSEIKSAKLDLGLNSERIPQSTDATLSLTTKDNTTTKLELGEVITTDGTIYVKISGLKKALSTATSYGDFNILDYFQNTITSVDGQWWMISVPDLIDKYNDDFNANIDESYADAYQCLINQFATNDGKELATLYQKYPFISVKPYDGKAVEPVADGSIFTISVESSLLTKYYKELPDTTTAANFRKCLQKIDGFDTDEVEEQLDEEVDDGLDEAVDKLPTIYMEISGWDHKLSRIYFDKAGDGASITADLQFSYPANIAIDTPNDAKPATELIDLVVDDVQNMLYDLSGGYYSYSGYTDDYSYDYEYEYFN